MQALAKGAAPRGFTLIELGVTIGILALAAMVVAPTLASVLGVRTREQVTRVAGSVRAMYGESVLSGRTCRLVFDLDAGEYWPECADGRVRVARTEESIRGARVEEQVAEILGDLPEDEARRQLQQRSTFGAYAAGLAPKGSLPEGVKLESVWTAHQSEPYTSGKAYLYFFPSGQTERAYLHIGDGDDTYTVIVDPMTGRAKVAPERIEVPDEELRP